MALETPSHMGRATYLLRSEDAAQTEGALLLQC